MKNSVRFSLLFLLLSCGLELQAADSVKWYPVRKVIDGDSLLLQDQDPRAIRLLGIDTPETHFNRKLSRDSRRSHRDRKFLLEMGRQSQEITRQLVSRRPVRLEFDQTTLDPYGRKLAYVYFRMNEAEFAKIMKLDFGKFRKPHEKEYLLNEELVRYGWAQTFRSAEFRLKAEFLALEREAREQRLGLWK